NAVIISKEVGNGSDCTDFVKRVKDKRDAPTTVFLTPHQGHSCDGVDHVLSTHDPDGLVNLMRSLFGDPRPPDSGP
ncbi:MAG: hypothetical protein JOY79_01725, partial [Acidobacteriaceae bacterium]|nr:hypothetical protein [Acidobacteriaceae bacterium]